MLVIISTLTLLIPFSSILKTVYALDNKNNYEYYPMSKDYDTDGSYYKDSKNYGKQYYYHYPLKDKSNDPKEQIQKCEECFFSELEKLDKKVASKMVYEIEREFGDLEKLCKLIINEKINRDQLEQILIKVLENLDYSKGDYSYEYPNKEEQYYDNYDNNDYNEVDNLYNYDSNYDYIDTYSYYNDNYEYDEYEYGYDYEYDYNYELDEQTKQQIIQNILNCLFGQIPEVLVVWMDNTFGNFDIFSSKSTDGGETFSTPENISNNPGTSALPAIAVNGNNVYIVWNDATFGNFDIFSSKSTDGGETFSTPENISNNPGNSALPAIAVNGNNVYVIWIDDTDGFDEIFFSKSTDGGETFSTPENISNIPGISAFPAIAVNGNNVYVVWSDDTDGFDEIFFSKSTDGGETFSTPEIISNNDIGNNDSFSYQPSISVYGNNVYVVWHDDPQGERNIFIVKSTDGGQTFSTPENLSEKFDFSTKSAIAIEGDNVYVVWIVDIPDNNDVFFSKSTDGGETFSTPENISDNPGFSNVPISVGSSTYEPSIIVIGNNVYVSWTDGTPGNWEILLTTSKNGGETFDKPENISNNAGESREPDLALLQ